MLRKQLESGELGPQTIVYMQEKQLGNIEYQKRVKAMEAEALANSRTDVMAEYMNSIRSESSTITCRRCKGKKVSVHFQQTRSADEPMTEFYNCIECGCSWRICP